MLGDEKAHHRYRMCGTIPKDLTQGVRLLADYLPAEGIVLMQVAMATSVPCLTDFSVRYAKKPHYLSPNSNFRLAMISLSGQDPIVQTQKS